MADSFQLNFQKTALLILDYQMLVIQNYLSEDQAKNVIKNTAKLLESIRSTDAKVIYVTVQFQEGHLEIDPRNKIFKDVKKFNLFRAGDAETAIHQQLQPIDHEPIIIKNRLGAFSSTNLDLLLRANGIETLILAGLTTSGVVLSTVCQAFDLDYNLYVVQDCCADSDDQVHQMLMKDIFPHHSNVVTSTQIIKFI